MAKAVIPPFSRVRRAIERSVREVVIPYVQEGVEREQRRFVAEIKRQNFPAIRRFPLSDAWAATKVRRKLDPRTFIATKTYIRGIRVLRSKRLGVYRFRVGFDRNARARDVYKRLTNIPLWKLAVWHEHGTSATPSRPHWRPFWQGASPRIRALLTSAVRRGMGSVKV